ncbi:MAG: molybdopterin-dependent oxidoreductase [Pirellulales bacterium]
MTEHQEVSRRYFLQQGFATGVVAVALGNPSATAQETKPTKISKPDKAGVLPEPYFTLSEHFGDVSRGKPIPHTLPESKLSEVGLTRDTWSLEVISDTASPAKIQKPITRENGTALSFDALLKLGEKSAVRFPKLMTCLNMGCPLGMGLWEGVPLREVIWMTEPQENLRRVFYYGFHNDDPKQIFRSSLPIGRVLEDPQGLPPVILCYKLNGQWLSPERGGPVRMVVPEHYGFKSVKWLTHVVLTNAPFANDTYAEQNNDVDSPLKTFAASLSVPRDITAGQAIQVSGYAQVGVTGLSKIQVSIEPTSVQRADDPHHKQAPWIDAEILPPPALWNS